MMISSNRAKPGEALMKLVNKGKDWKRRDSGGEEYGGLIRTALG